MQHLIAAARQAMEFYPDSTIVSADDTFAALECFCRQRAVERIAVFTGTGSVERAGHWSVFLNALATLNPALQRFGGIPAEPDTENVAAMTGFLRDTRPDLVIAFGGGSVMDAAKAALIVTETGLPLEECFGASRIAALRPGRNFRRIVAVPTTSGTGSEVTPYSNIVNRARGVKQLISDPALIPELALLRADFTASMPESVTLATGCDALAHLLEGWLNVGQDGNHAAVNGWAETGAMLIREALPRLNRDGGDRAARQAMQLAATLGGMTIRFKSTGLPHLASFSWFGRIPHGVAVARLLPEAWRFYLGNPAVAERTMAVARVFPGKTPAEVIASYEQFLDACRVPRLGDYPGLDEELMRLTARSAGSNRMKLELAPRPVTPEESEEVLSAMLERALER